MSTPNKDQLLSEIAQFLEDDQEMYGPFTFTAEEEAKILDRSESVAEEVVSETVSEIVEDEVVGEEVSEIADDEIVSEANSEIAEDEVVGDTVLKATDQSDSKLESDLQQPLPLPLKEKLETCQDLDQLRQLCEEADDLHTDLEGTRLVFGVGNPHADLMLIGEAPGEQEDKEGEPFVGAAGQLLSKILSAIDFKREDVYIANILKHRPPGNRNPNPEELLRSLPYLLRQIDLIQPKLILCLGKVSGTTLLDKEDSLKNLRGEFYPFRNTLLTVTYHPAALLRNPQWKRPVWEDVQKVKKKVAELSDG